MTSGPSVLASALWVGAWLRGAASPDDVLDALAGLAPESAPGTLLAEVRAARPERVWLLLPRPGRLVGWPRSAPGPAAAAVLLTSHEASGALVRPGRGRWTVVDVGPVDVRVLEASALSARQARRELDACLAESAARLERLDLARAASGRARTAWSSAVAAAPSGLGPEESGVLHRAAAVLDALGTALADDGAAVTSLEASARADEVRALAGRLEDLVAGVVGGLNPRPVA